MNISHIPAAINYAGNTSGKLKPYVSGEAKTASSSGGSSGGSTSDSLTAEHKMYRSIYSCDNTYTKDDALTHKWLEQFNYYFDDIFGVKDTASAPRPSAIKSKEEIEKMLQDAGPSKEVDWSNLSIDFRGTDFGFSDVSKALAFYNKDDLARRLNYITSRYAAVEDKILKNYKGGERQEQMDKLNGIYGKALDRLAENYGSLLGKIMEENGVSGEAEKISASVRSAAAQRVDSYRESLSNHAGLAALKGTKDAWLLGDDEYVAAALRGEYSGEAAKTEKAAKANPAKAVTEAAPYTARDLDVLNTYVFDLSNFFHDGESTAFSVDEESLALDFAMLDMKTDTLKKSGTLSSAMSATIGKFVQGCKNATLDRIEDAMDYRRSHPKVSFDKRGFAKLDRESVWSVHARVMEEYRRTGDAIKSLLSGVSFGRKQRNQKISSGQAEGVYRYTNSQMFWEDFDKPTASKIYGYRADSTPFAQYRSGWEDFKASISQDHVRLNLTILGPTRFDPYYTGIPNLTIAHA